VARAELEFAAAIKLATAVGAEVPPVLKGITTPPIVIWVETLDTPETTYSA